VPEILCILLTGGAYAPDATCMATPLRHIQKLTVGRVCMWTLQWYFIRLTSQHEANDY